jgi:hypothetical protein
MSMSLPAIRQYARCAAHPCRDLPFEGRIFICYRHVDERVTDDLCEQLERRLARRGQVFRDIKDIRTGEDYRHAVQRALKSCYAVLVIIGPEWLELRDADGEIKITKPRDPVREELELAMESLGNVRVIPVLVEGAAMPRAGQLPESIARLAYRIAAELPPRKFAAAFDASIGDLFKRLENPPKSHFAEFGDIKGAPPPLPLLVANAVLRPFWSNVFLPLAVVLAGLVISGAWWLVPVGVVLWLVLGAVTLFDSRQLRCAARCFEAAMPSAEPVDLSAREDTALVE